MALARTRRLAAALAALPLALVLATAGGVQAQDPVGDAFCTLLTPDEVAQALGDTVTAGSSFGTCSWASDNGEGSYVFMSASWDSMGLDERMGTMDGTPLTVAGHRAYYAPEFDALYIELDAGVLLLQAIASAEGTDLQAALTGLGELAAPRAGAVPAPPSPAPTPSPQPAQHADPALEALFPQTVGGKAVAIESAPASVLASDDESSQRIADVLANQGKTLDDVTIAFGYPEGFSSSIFAFRIAGADASAMLGPLLASQAQSQEMTQAPGQVAGKNVTVVTSGGSTQYYYPKDDIIWIVAGQEPALTEIFTALP